MKAKTIVLRLSGVLVLLAVVLFAVPVQASETGNILVTVDYSGPRWQTTNLVLFDQNWVAIEEVVSSRSVHQFSGKKLGKYHVVAYNVEGDQWGEEAVDLKAAETVVVQLTPKSLPAEQGQNEGYRSGRACGGAVGDGRFLKVYPPNTATIVYLQCGRVVGKVFQGGCPNCGGSGWRYVNYCQKSQPIYVTLPCNR